jgi:hypothetical protein
VPGVDTPPDIETFQGTQRHWLVTGNDLGNWIATRVRIFGHSVAKSVSPPEKRAVPAAFG